MKVPAHWLREYVDFDGSAVEMARRLTLAGFDVEDVVPLPDGDARLDVDVPSNRPDCLGVIGIARELAAATGKTLKIPTAAPTEPPDSAQGGDDAAAPVRVFIKAPAACPRYTARRIRGVRVGPSPDWMRARLEAVGLAPVNNVVDITNYVLFECGQPLHAFDADRLRGGVVTVRMGRAGEKLAALNGREYPCGPDILVIADGKGPVAFAGVMGGKLTEIGPGTTDVLLESAQFDPVTIRRASRKLGLASDSSYRFERGVSWEGVDWASRRSASLIQSFAAGRPDRVATEAGGPAPASRRIPFRPDRCSQSLGLPCELADVRRFLEAIGCSVKEEGVGRLAVTVSEHRRDLLREADLFEEIARLTGYDRIPVSTHIPIVVAVRDRQGAVEQRAREVLTALGYQESLTPSFAEPATAADLRLEAGSEPVIVLGKAGAPDRPLRMSVASSLLGVLRTNERYGTVLPRVFEIATAYGRVSGGAPVERLGLGLAAREEFRVLRGHVEALARAMRIPLTIERTAGLPAPWPAVRCAALRSSESRLGAIAELDAAAARRWDLQHGASVAELDFGAWIAAADLTPRHRDFPRVPESVRDLAVVVDAAVPWERVEASVRAAAPPWLERLEPFDEFRGAQIPAGRKSLAFSMTFRHPERTLTREEADAAVRVIVERMGRDLGAVLRA